MIVNTAGVEYILIATKEAIFSAGAVSFFFIYQQLALV